MQSVANMPTERERKTEREMEFVCLIINKFLFSSHCSGAMTQNEPFTTDSFKKANTPTKTDTRNLLRTTSSFAKKGDIFLREKSKQTNKQLN